MQYGTVQFVWVELALKGTVAGLSSSDVKKESLPN